MSDEDKGFLARWSQRKRDAGKTAERTDADASSRSDVSAQTGAAPSEPLPVPSETEPQFDLDSLPKLDELTASTDMTVFFKKGVPESIRNAALRKSWALDPAVRNYVNPALDYAYDWNTPGGVPGSGELAPGTDIARMVAQVMGVGKPQAESVDKRDADEADRRNDPDADAAEHQSAPDLPPSAVRLSEASPVAKSSFDTPQISASSSTESGAEPETQPEPADTAPQQSGHRHGSARPR
jgi:hypothetical protein